MYGSMNEPTKVCQTCWQSKLIDCFKKEPRCKDGVTPHCKECIGKKKKEYRNNNHSHYLDLEKRRRDKPEVKEYSKMWREEHREEQLDKAKERYKSNPAPYLRRSKEQKLRDPYGYKAYQWKWRKANKKWYRDYYHNVNKKNINWRIKNTLRGSLRKALNGKNKTGSVLKYLGCPLEFFRGYLEGKFTSGMTWDNYGVVWHIDHHIPCISFDMTNETERHKCFHYTNLQPLLAGDNCSKQDKMPDGTFSRKQLTTAVKVV